MKLELKKAYCINLENRKDRWEKSKEEFKKLDFLDIELVRLDAIHDSLPSVGLWKSFHKILKKAKEENLEYVFCLEDDFWIIDPKKIAICFENVPDDFDFLSGGTYYMLDKKNIDENWMTCQFCSTHFIIIRNTLYDILLNFIYSKTNRLPIDRYISNLQKTLDIKCYIMNPMPVRQYAGFSDIIRHQVDHNARNKRKLPWIDDPIYGKI